MPESFLETVDRRYQQLYGKRMEAKVLEQEVSHNQRTPARDTGLAMYNGEWGIDQVTHLLRRTSFGFSRNQLLDLLSKGLDRSVDDLLEDRPSPGPPLNHYFTADPDVPVGETWVNAPDDIALRTYRRRSLYAWTFKLMQDPLTSLREKMVLFWHNHFVTADINEPRITYRYIDTIRKNALGNFRELTKLITIDPAMLLYLNGHQNTNRAPNENYARELLELFTVGKGPLAAPGDYTTFTEDDVAAMSKVLTGWRVRGAVDNQNPEYAVHAVFRPNLHDTSTKVLSHRFDNAQIEHGGENEYKDLIDIIFTKPDVALNISRRLYRWFVHYNIDEQIESSVIEPLAQILIANDYEIKPALSALLKSEHFFHPDVKGCMIKNPIDFLTGIFTAFEVPIPERLDSEYQAYNEIYNVAVGLQMQYYGIPQVAGWKAYYQEPVFYRIWINSTTIPIRHVITDVMAFLGYRARGEKVIIDILTFVQKLPNPEDPNALIRDMVMLLLPFQATQARIDALKEVLIPGLPDFEWTVEYNDYLADPDNQLLRAVVEQKLRNLISTIMRLPEYNLC